MLMRMVNSFTVTISPSSLATLIATNLGHISVLISAGWKETPFGVKPHFTLMKVGILLIYFELVTSSTLIFFLCVFVPGCIWDQNQKPSIIQYSED